MNLRKLYKRTESSILDGQFILIDYGLFFNDAYHGKYTRFVIDDPSEIQQLKDILKIICRRDSNARVYVCAYGNELVDSNGDKFLYADSIWINGSSGKESIRNEFQNNMCIEPSSIELLTVMGERGQSPILYFSINGEVLDLSLPPNLRYLENVITLYWD